MCEERRTPSGVQQGTVSALSGKDRMTRMLLERAHGLEVEAKGMRRLAELMGASCQQDVELFSTLSRLVFKD